MHFLQELIHWRQNNRVALPVVPTATFNNYVNNFIRKRGDPHS